MKNIFLNKYLKVEKTLGNLWFIPSHYLETVNNYNKEKVITPTTGISETAKIPLNFSFISVSETIFINTLNIYIYIYIERERERDR